MASASAKALAMEDKRLFFQEGKQREMLQFLANKYGLTHREIGRQVGIQRRTITGYFSGTKNIRLSSFHKLISIYPEMSVFEQFIEKQLPLNWGSVKGGKKGMHGLWVKYGIETISAWRKKEYKERKIPLSPTKEIIVPKEINLEIAELLGAYIGDGTITKYFIRIAGDKRFDKSYFKYLSGLFKKNFGVTATITEVAATNQLSLEIRSLKLIQYFTKTFDLALGDKIRNKTKIPECILQSEDLTKACLRGLMDTDGSVSRRSTYMCLAFTAHSPVLLDQVYGIGLKFGYFTYKGHNQTGSNSWKKIRKYFAEVGSSNLRHIVRFEERLRNNRFLYQEDILKYLPEYQNLTLVHFGPMV